MYTLHKKKKKPSINWYCQNITTPHLHKKNITTHNFHYITPSFLILCFSCIFYKLYGCSSIRMGKTIFLNPHFIFSFHNFTSNRKEESVHVRTLTVVEGSTIVLTSRLTSSSSMLVSNSLHYPLLI